MSTENLERISEGRAASLTESVVRPIIEDRISVLTSRLTGMYHAGDTQHDKLVGLIAEIASMQHLLSELSLKQRQGIKAAEREYHGTTEEVSPS